MRRLPVIDQSCHPVTCQQHHRHDDADADQHDYALYQVGIGYGEEPAQYGVYNHDYPGQDDGGGIGEPERFANRSKYKSDADYLPAE